MESTAEELFAQSCQENKTENYEAKNRDKIYHHISFEGLSSMLCGKSLKLNSSGSITSKLLPKGTVPMKDSGICPEKKVLIRGCGAVNSNWKILNKAPYTNSNGLWLSRPIPTQITKPSPSFHFASLKVYCGACRTYFQPKTTNLWSHKFMNVQILFTSTGILLDLSGSWGMVWLY